MTASRPSVQKQVPLYMHRALFWLAKYVEPRPKERSASDYRKIIVALEQVRDDLSLSGSPVAPHRFQQKEGFKRQFQSMIDLYRWEERSARVTKPKDRSQRTVLAILRHDFSVYFGNPMNQAVALLMEAAFGGRWDANTVRTRASEWEC